MSNVFNLISEDVFSQKMDELTEALSKQIPDNPDAPGEDEDSVSGLVYVNKSSNLKEACYYYSCISAIAHKTFTIDNNEVVRFVAVPGINFTWGNYGNGYDCFYYSDDGLSWSATEGTNDWSDWTDICATTDGFIAIATGRDYAFASLDGINWTRIELPAQLQWSSITESAQGDLFLVAYDSNIAYRGIKTGVFEYDWAPIDLGTSYKLTKITWCKDQGIKRGYAIGDSTLVIFNEAGDFVVSELPGSDFCDIGVLANRYYVDGISQHVVLALNKKGTVAAFNLKNYSSNQSLSPFAINDWKSIETPLTVSVKLHCDSQSKKFFVIGKEGCYSYQLDLFYDNFGNPFTEDSQYIEYPFFDTIRTGYGTTTFAIDCYDNFLIFIYNFTDGDTETTKTESFSFDFGQSWQQKYEGLEQNAENVSQEVADVLWPRIKDKIEPPPKYLDISNSLVHPYQIVGDRYHTGLEVFYTSKYNCALGYYKSQDQQHIYYSTDSCWHWQLSKLNSLITGVPVYATESTFYFEKIDSNGSTLSSLGGGLTGNEDQVTKADFRDTTGNIVEIDLSQPHGFASSPDKILIYSDSYFGQRVYNKKYKYYFELTFTNLPFSSQAKVIYGNGVWVAVDNNLSTAGVSYSLDGITWVKTEQPVPEKYALLFGNNRFVIVYSKNNNVIVNVSTNGIDWSGLVTVPITLPPNRRLGQTDFVFIGDRFLCLSGYSVDSSFDDSTSGGISCYSYDGLTWETDSTIPVTNLGEVPSGDYLYQYVASLSPNLLLANFSTEEYRTTDGYQWHYVDTKEKNSIIVKDNVNLTPQITAAVYDNLVKNYSISILPEQWENNIATVSLSQISQLGLVFVKPSIHCVEDYETAGVRYLTHTDGTLKMKCDTPPTKIMGIQISTFQPPKL